MADACEHLDFSATVGVGRLTDGDGGPVTSWCADIKIQCAKCGRPMQFLGLPLGVNLRGPTMSVDGLEARLALMPQGEVPHPLKGFQAFTFAGDPNSKPKH